MGGMKKQFDVEHAYIHFKVRLMACLFGRCVPRGSFDRDSQEAQHLTDLGMDVM
jgi:hypothetical protein